MSRQQFRPNQLSAGGVVVRPDARAGFEVCLVCDGRYWGLPKGIVERGERPEEAALREIAEEVGLDRQTLRLSGDLPLSEYVFRRERRLIFKRVHFFLVEAAPGAELVAQADELTEARWCTFSEAKRLASFPDTVTALAAAERLLGSRRAASA